jgi:predicted sugar kinase
MHTPVARADVYEGLSTVYHGLAPAVLTENFPVFKDSMISLQQLGFKQLEIARQPPEVAESLAYMNRLDWLVAGMTSMGPLIFVISPYSVPESERMFEALLDRMDADLGRASSASVMGVYAFRNAGFELDT